MSLPLSLDRRDRPRGPLHHARRRYPRLRVTLDAFYESEWTTHFAEQIDLSLRGLFLPCHSGDPEGLEATVRLALPGGPMLRSRVVVVRRSEVGHKGMALRFVDMSDADRLRLGAFLIRAGGLAQIPQLDARFAGWSRLPHPLLRRERRKANRETPAPAER